MKLGAKMRIGICSRESPGHPRSHTGSEGLRVKCLFGNANDVLKWWKCMPFSRVFTRRPLIVYETYTDTGMLDLFMSELR